jgi:hypothetical protein
VYGLGNFRGVTKIEYGPVVFTDMIGAAGSGFVPLKALESKFIGNTGLGPMGLVATPADDVKLAISKCWGT